MNYLVIKTNGSSTKYECESSHGAPQFMRVGGGSNYLDLTTATTTGAQLKIKIDDKIYRPMQTYTTVVGSQKTVTVTTGYSGATSRGSTSGYSGVKSRASTSGYTGRISTTQITKVAGKIETKSIWTQYRTSNSGYTSSSLSTRRITITAHTTSRDTNVLTALVKITSWYYDITNSSLVSSVLSTTSSTSFSTSTTSKKINLTSTSSTSRWYDYAIRLSTTRDGYGTHQAVVSGWDIYATVVWTVDMYNSFKMSTTNRTSTFITIDILTKSTTSSTTNSAFLSSSYSTGSKTSYGSSTTTNSLLSSTTALTRSSTYKTSSSATVGLSSTTALTRNSQYSTTSTAPGSLSSTTALTKTSQSGTTINSTTKL